MIIYYHRVSQKWCRKWDRLPRDDVKLRNRLNKLAEWCRTDMHRMGRGA